MLSVCRWFVFIVLLVGGVTAAEGDVRFVPEAIECEMSFPTSDASGWLFVGVTKDRELYMAAMENTRKKRLGIAKIAESNAKKVIKLLEQGIEWGEKAQANELTTLKKVGDAYTTSGAKGKSRDGVSFNMRSSQDGKEVVIVVVLWGHNNSNAGMTVVTVSLDGARKLLELWKQLPDEYKKIKENKEKVKELLK